MIVAVFLAAALVAYIAGNPLSRYRDREAANCRTQCAKGKMLGRLVSQNPVGSLSGGKYDGPWRCECY